MLQAENLSKSYKSRCIVDNLSLTVGSGEVVGLLGPNGAGKTTCFYMVVGLVQSDKGCITLGDLDITRLPMHARARKGLGYLPQEASIFRKLSVEENILAILQTQPQLSTKRREEKLAELLQELHISHIQNSMGMSLSGGERRRVEIARALATEPKFILMDEPFAGVDPISVLDIQKIIQQLKDKGIGVLITDHSVRETLGICDRAYIMNQGRLMVEGAPEKILGNQGVRDVYLGNSFRM